MAKELSRRDFIKGVAAGAFGVAAAGVLGSMPVVAAAEEAKYTPGTYTATAKGIASDVKVTMTFSENAITDVVIDAAGETPELGGAAAPKLAQAILDAQGLEVDAVSGATVTSDAVKKAVADCISQASGKAIVVQETESFNADWLGEAPEIAEADIKEELETEVLVVGCGTGGWIAAMTAAEEGAKVLVVEKAETPTKIKEDIGAINSRLQLESFEQYPEFRIDKIEALQEIVRYASGYVDSDLVKVWIDNSGETVDWLTDILEGTGHWYMSLEGGVGDLNHPERDKAYATGHSPIPWTASPTTLTSTPT